MNTAGLLVQNVIWQTSQSETGETWADITDTRVLFILIPLQNVRFTSSASIVFKFFIESNGYSWCVKCRRTANTGIHTHTRHVKYSFLYVFCVCVVSGDGLFPFLCCLRVRCRASEGSIAKCHICIRQQPTFCAHEEYSSFIGTKQRHIAAEWNQRDVNEEENNWKYCFTCINNAIICNSPMCNGRNGWFTLCLSQSITMIYI